MIKKALNELKEKKGASRLAIHKFIMSHFRLGENPVKVKILIHFIWKYERIVSKEINYSFVDQCPPKDGFEEGSQDWISQAD